MTDAAPAIVTGEAERPTVRLPEDHSWRWTALLLLSAAAHAALYLPFGREPPPMASIGEVSMSVEIVLGSQRPAGLTAKNATSDTASPTPAQSAEPAEQLPPEPEAAMTDIAAVEPPLPTEAAESAKQAAPEPEHKLVDTMVPTEPDPKSVETAVAPESALQPPAAQQKQLAALTPETVTPQPVPSPESLQQQQQPAPAVQAPSETTPAPEWQASVHPQAASEINTPAATEPPPVELATAPPLASPPVATPKIAPPRATIVREPPRKRAEPLKPQAKLAKPELERPATRTERKPERRAALRGEPNDSRTTAPASTAANGAGVGRSDASTNYRGVVAAHLARHKQFPQEARSRGDQGSAVLTFALDGGGRVTSVSLSRGTGLGALDGEAVAMVRRASPFPPPPNGHGMSFTVPVSFRIF